MPPGRFTHFSPVCVSLSTSRTFSALRLRSTSPSTSTSPVYCLSSSPPPPPALYPPPFLFTLLLPPSQSLEWCFLLSGSYRTGGYGGGCWLPACPPSFPLPSHLLTHSLSSAPPPIIISHRFALLTSVLLPSPVYPPSSSSHPLKQADRGAFPSLLSSLANPLPHSNLLFSVFSFPKVNFIPYCCCLPARI